MKPDDLLDELREWRGNVDDIIIDDREVTLSLLDFAAFVRNREHAAAERMRERCALDVRIAKTDARLSGTDATAEALRAISKLEPEEPTP